MSRSRRSRATRGAKALRAGVAVLLQVLAAVVGLQMGGVIHAANDVVSICIAGGEHDDGCPLDGPCDDCPAECPSCHCSNGFRTLAVPPPEIQLSLLAEAPMTVEWVDAREPAPPDLPSVYRPPRDARSVA
jgi:hypothetical protein